MTVSTETADHLMIDEGYQGASPNARFLAGDVPHGANEKVRIGNALSLSMVSHVGGFFLVLFLISIAPPPTVDPNPFDMPKDIVWIAQQGPGGGGGGGGNRMPDPPRRAELPGKDKITVPVAKPPKLQAPEPPKDVPKPEPQINIPAVTTQAGLQEIPGAISAVPSSPTSQGLGTGGGAGTGRGTGIGSGQGSGLGPGHGGGTGGGAFRLGDAGVVPPRLLKEVKPAYTGDAMRAKIQGVVTVEAIVMPDGRVGEVQVIRSLDRTFGLDEEAIKAVRRWLFAPATRFGQPVPIQIEVELTFTLR